MALSFKHTLRTGVALLAIASPLSMASTLRIDNAGEPGTLDPQSAHGLLEVRILQEMYDTLLTFDAHGNIVPGLAESWTLSADGRTITFHLREAKWSDGQPITAQDAVFGLQRSLSPSTLNMNAYFFYAIVNAKEVNTGKLPASALGIKAVNDRTFEVTLTEPTSYLLEEFTGISSAPLPRHRFKKMEDQGWTTHQPVVSGPYQLDHWTPQVELKLNKNPAFYGAEQVKVDDIVMYPIQEPTTAFNRYRSQALDISYSEVPSSRFDWLKQNMPKDIVTFPTLSHYFYLPNANEGQPLADKRIREAMNLVVQRELITDKILNNGYTPSSAILPQVLMDGRFKAKAYYDEWPMPKRLERAKALMKEAGYGPDHPLNVELSYNTRDDHRRVAVALSAMWKPLGINVTLQTRDIANHYKNIDRGQFQLARYGMIPAINNPVEYFSMFVSGAPDNHIGYANPIFDQHVKAAINATASDVADREWGQAQQVLMDDMATIPLMDMAMTYLVSPRVKGWYPNPLDIHMLRYVSLDAEAHRD